MATIRDLAAKVVAAGFTGKKYRNASTGVKPSPRRAKIGNADFDQLGKRQQKIVRRMAVQHDLVMFNAEQMHWQLTSTNENEHRCCNIRAKDAHTIGILKFVKLTTTGFSAMLNAVRSHYQL